jgi:hypothetical protein
MIACLLPAEYRGDLLHLGPNALDQGIFTAMNIQPEI